ncbi:MAG: hypothetical protein E6I32_09225 [Chloroflexi bacterium]|nr:MAG: hypothetical protein E6I32_09225 [Chloroflexota bacterium]
MQPFEKCSFPSEAPDMIAGEPNHSTDDLFGPRMVFFSFIALTSMSFVLLTIIRQQRRKETS